ncbi:MAG TPA: MFS transporter [Thermoplasmata archaeon]|nr:MFS transporter [Thermoplasmata archaeon]
MVLLPLYTKEHGISDQFYGYAFAIQSASFVVSSISGGHLSDILGRKPLIIIGWLIAVISPILLQSGFLFLSMAFLGLGSGLNWSAFDAYIADSTESSKLSTSYGLIRGIPQLIAAIGPFLAGYIVARAATCSQGLTLALWITAGIMGLTVLLALFLRETKRMADKKNKKIQFTTEEKSIIIDYSIVASVVGLGAGLTIPYYAIYYLERFGVDPTQLGTIQTLCCLFMAIAFLFAGYLGDKVDKLKIWRLCYLVAIPAAFGIITANALALSTSFYVGRMAIANMAWPCWTAYLMTKINPRIRGKALGITWAVDGVSRMIGRAVGGHVFGLIGGWIFPTAAIMYWLVAVYAVWHLKQPKSSCDMLPPPASK